MVNRGSDDAPKRPVQRSLFAPPGAPDEVDAAERARAEPRVAPAPTDAAVRALAARLPERLRLGTSSWNFAGWRGLVYARDAAVKQLSRHGLAAYAQHPLLGAVGVDRTFYGPVAAAEFAHYRAAVPDRFRFVVKAWGELLSPTLHGRPGANAGYLDAQRTGDECVQPAIDGLGDRLGAVLLQFPPQGRDVVREPRRFADRLHAFVGRLPRGVVYAVELRDAELFTAHYVDALAAAGARHGYVVHPRMPPLARQRELAPLVGPVTVRWMLHAGFAYEEAKQRYQPFDALVDADPANRTAIAALCADAAALGLDVTVVVNNKAEGSAPLSLVALAEAIAAGQRG